MLFFDATLETLAENLALDEALLLQAESGGPEVLRLWEWPSRAVVLGAGCKLAEDVNEDACLEHRVPILRRGSGGGTVLLGPGCLLYSLILRYDKALHLQNIRSSYEWILARIVDALAPLGMHLELAGTSDLAVRIDDREGKVSGNSQQRKQRNLLHHGTLLYRFDIGGAERFLRMPARQPEYRRQRSHRDFLVNLPASAEEIRPLLRTAWSADEPLAEWPREMVCRLVEEKYGRREWIRRR